MYDIYCSNSGYPCHCQSSEANVTFPTITTTSSGVSSSSFAYPGEPNKLNYFTATTSTPANKPNVRVCTSLNNNTVHLSEVTENCGSATSDSESCTFGARTSLLVTKQRIDLSCVPGQLSYTDSSAGSLKLKDLLAYNRRPSVDEQNCLTMDYGQTPDSRLMVDDLEPQQRNRCNTWPLRPIGNPPSIHDSESNPAEGVIKEEAEDLEGEDGNLSKHNHSGGPDNLGVSGSQNLNSSNELGSQNDINNVKKSTSRKNAWGKFSITIFRNYGMFLIDNC